MAQRRSIARVTFDRLLCGDAQLQGLSGDAAVRAAATAFRARFPAAPLPVPLAAAFGRGLLAAGDARACAALMAAHPSAGAAAAALAGPDADAAALLRCAEERQTPPAAREVLFAGALRTAGALGTKGTLRTEGTLGTKGTLGTERETAGEAARAAARLAVVRQMRETPRAAGALIGALCDLSDAANEAERTAAHDALLAALRHSFVSPRDYASVLRLLSRGGDHNRVLALWTWMRHSSARWDKEAASVLITSAALARKMNVAIGAIQVLAEANEDPTLEAQRYFIRHLASRAPPQPRYADQLVLHWHPDPAELWTTPAREVAVELLFVHYKIKNCARVRELMETAGKAANSEAERQEILRLPGMPFILRHFAVDVEHEPWLKQLCDSGQTMNDLADLPLLVGFLASLTRHNGDVESFLNTARGIKMTQENFERMVNFVADDICFKNAKETLTFITALAEAFSLEVPTDVSSWLQLLG